MTFDVTLPGPANKKDVNCQNSLVEGIKFVKFMRLGNFNHSHVESRILAIKNVKT